MDEKIEIYKHIYETSEMSINSINELINALKNKDNKIKGILGDIKDDFKRYEKISKEKLKECDSTPEEVNMFSKMMANMGIRKEVNNDNSDSNIAEVMLQGISMGSITMERKIDDYKDKIDKNDLDISNEYLEFMRETTEKLKEYL